MCIRDSNARERLVAVGGQLRVRSACDEGTEIRVWGRMQDCLLYTSDAADDLLCVDLGGRRIIKNKIRRYLHTTCT